MGMVIVTTLFLVIGFFGYLKYGESIQPSISLNLPSEEKLAQAVKILLAIGVLLGFALQFFIAIQIMWPSLVERFQWKTHLLLRELVFRVLMVFVTCEYNVLIVVICIYGVRQSQFINRERMIKLQLCLP